MLTISATSFSKGDAEQALRNKVCMSITVKQYRYTANGRHWARFTVWNGKKYVTACRFIALNDLLQARVQRMIARSKEVEFQGCDGLYAITSHGHVCNYEYCNCEAFQCEQTDRYKTQINGKRVCKHTIAYSKKYHGIATLKEFASFILN